MKTRRWGQVGYHLVMSPAFLPLCLGNAFAARLLWVLCFDVEPASDFAYYFRLAVNLADGQGYGPYGNPTAFNPPGYPLFLAGLFRLFGVSVLAGTLANVVLQVGTLALAYLLAREIFRSEFVGRVACAILAVHPNNIAYSALLANESLFMCLFLAAAYLTLLAVRKSWWWALPAGGLWGYAGLVKPQGLVLPFIMLALLLLAARQRCAFFSRLRVGVLVALALGITVIPWVLRNYFIYHEPLFNTTMGYNLLMGNNPNPSGSWMNLWNDPATKGLLPPATHNEFLDNKAARKAARAYLRRHPLSIITHAPKKLFYFLYEDGDGVNWALTCLRHPPPLQQSFLRCAFVLAQLYYLLCWIAFVLALLLLPWRRLWKRRPLALLGPVFILYFTAVIVVYYGMPRYHVPLIPWMAFFIALLLRERAKTPILPR